MSKIVVNPSFSVEEGRYLFNITSLYGIVNRRAKETPERQGDWAELSDHEQLVLRVWRRLKLFARKTGQGLMFGPEKTPEGWSTGPFPLDEEDRDGLYYALLGALDPKSPLHDSFGRVVDQGEFIWPIAERIGAAPALRKELGLEKPKREKIKYDEGEIFPAGSPNGEEKAPAQTVEAKTEG